MHAWAPQFNRSRSPRIARSRALTSRYDLSACAVRPRNTQAKQTRDSRSCRRRGVGKRLVAFRLDGAGAEFMMTRELAPGRVRVACPDGYCAASVAHNTNVLTVEVKNGNDIAARGQLALDGRVGVFDQVVTDEAHRRRGLGTLVMGLLSESAARMGVDKGVLVATEDGLKLHTALGWVVHSPVASAVIEDGSSLAPPSSLEQTF